MHIYRIVSGLFVLIMLQSCSTTSLVDEGETAFKEGNYKTALAQWEAFIQEKEAQYQLVDSSIYYKAGMAALKLHQKTKARDYLKSADKAGYSSPELYATLSGMYKSINNLTLEIDALEKYHEQYSQGKRIDSMNVRLFETYVESKQWNKAEGLWPELPEQPKSELEMKKTWFKVNKELDNDAICDSLAGQILQKEPDNLAALEWNALRYFNKADDIYVKLMNKYNKERTHENYNKLMDVWDEIWADYKKSRAYFERLYKLNPKPQYATYLGHIYKRDDKDQKAEYWYKKAEKRE